LELKQIKKKKIYDLNCNSKGTSNSKDVRNSAVMPETSGTARMSGMQQKQGCQQEQGPQQQQERNKKSVSSCMDSNSADASNNRTPITKGRISATEIQAIAACQQH
jgi:hypothetical protein